MRNLILVLCLLPSLAWAENPILPDPNLTPGIFDATATVDKVCQKGYTATVRHVTDKQKDDVFREYGLERSGNYEVDHLISLELGGSNDTRNLWPESYTGKWNARLKDSLEKMELMLIKITEKPFLTQLKMMILKE